MKNITSLILTFLLVTSISYLQAQEVQQYGAEISTKGAVEASKITKKLKKKENAPLKVQGKIVKTCPVKGCWMTLDMGNGETMMVRFKDYAFFVPKEGQQGKIAFVEGTAKKEVIDVETLRHYAEDAGKSKEEIAAITAPETKWTFEAKGVVIK